jgi:hypothetical protein
VVGNKHFFEKNWHLAIEIVPPGRTGGKVPSTTRARSSTTLDGQLLEDVVAGEDDGFPGEDPVPAELVHQQALVPSYRYFIVETILHGPGPSR